MIPVFDVSRVIGWVKTIALAIFIFTATKMLMIAIVFTLVPIAIYKGWLMIHEKLFAYITNNMGDVWNGTLVELTGLAGWLADNLRFQETIYRNLNQQ